MGALTGISAVISPRHDMTEEMTVPMMMYETRAPPGPALARDWPLPRKRPAVKVEEKRETGWP